MKESKLFMLLPEDLVCTPDGLEPDPKTGNLILSAPNFADLSMPSCMCVIDKDRNIRKWFDVPKNPATGEARAMGIAFGPDGDLYIVDNPGWLGRADLIRTGRILRVRMDGDKIVYCKTVAKNMEHPNGVKIQGRNVYVTQSTLELVKTESGKLMSCVYRFDLDDEEIDITNTLEDKNILETFITQSPTCQYGVDGIIFDHEGRLLIGNFGDGAVHRLTLSEDGLTVLKNELWAQDQEQMLTTDGMTIDEKGNIYVADFSANAIGKITPEGVVSRYAQSPDTDGFHGELDQPGEPCVWNGKLIVSCFDLVTDEQKVNTAHEMPATMCMLDLE